MADCLAAVITSFNEELEIQRVPLPELAPQSILIRVDAATLCGTDTHRWQGHFGTPPFIPGHETCGTIVDLRKGFLERLALASAGEGRKLVEHAEFHGASLLVAAQRTGDRMPTG